MQNETDQQYPQLEKKKGNKKVLFLLIAFLCGVLGIFLILVLIRGNTPQSKIPSITSSKISTEQSTMQPLPQINTVVLTTDGFSPSKITIQKGTAVRWINNSNTDSASVNSDDYPTNQLYPELNLGKVGKGANVAHIFTTPGIYTYHNQFNPKQTGTVTVK